MRRPVLLALLALPLVAVVVLPRAVPPAGVTAGNTAAETPTTAALQRAITAALDAPGLPPTLWGVAVRNLKTGETVYARNAELPMVPASNMKLLTTAAALDALGPDWRYTTQLWFRGEADDATGTLRGDLILKGAGDPTFGSVLSGRDPLRQWARALAEMGVRRIEGRVIGDDDVFEDTPYPDGWGVEQVSSEAWAPASGGLSYQDNTVPLRIAGTAPGRAATLESSPEGYAAVTGELGTRGGRGGYSPFRLKRALGSADVSVTGTVSASYRGTVMLPVEDPTRLTLLAFRDRLRDAEIALDGAQFIDIDDARETDALYTGARPLFTYVSPPLLTILKITNEKSNNFYAEQLFRTIGSGSDDGGTRRVVAFLQGAGIDTGRIEVQDGSGMSRKDYVTPTAFVQLLAHMSRHKYRDAYFESLAQGGEAGSTLKYRLGGVEVSAKTGGLENVRSLSGVVTGADGAPYAFSILANNFVTRNLPQTAAQNRVVLAIAGKRE